MMMFDRLRLKPLIFSSTSAPSSATSSPSEAFSHPGDAVPQLSAANRIGGWLKRNYSASSVTSSGTNSAANSPLMTRRTSSPVVDSVVNLFNDVKKDLENVIRNRDVYILANESEVLVLQDSSLWALNHIAVVQDLVNMQHNGYKQDLDHLVRYADEEWELSEAELIRERGVWGPTRPCALHKWMLDSTEGPCRMRKKLTRNDEFYQHYPHRTRQELLNFKTKHKKPHSFDSREYYRRVMGLSDSFDKEDEVNGNNLTESKAESTKATNNEQILDKTISDENSTDFHNITITQSNIDMLNTSQTDVPDSTNNEGQGINNSSDNKTMTKHKVKPSPEHLIQKNFPPAKSPGDLPVSESLASLQEQENKPDNRTVLRLLEEGERIKHMFRCARVQGLDTYEGLLLFGRDNFYIIDGFTMLKTKEIREISSLSPGYHEPIIPQSSRPSCSNESNNPIDIQQSSTTKHVCSRFSYHDIREVHKRRYLLQDIALETFSSDGRNYLLVFPQGTRNKVYSKFLSVATTLTDDTKDLVAGQKSMVNIEQQGPAILSNIIGEKTVTQRWERGEISNFQYLMYLNTLAGRSYNDLMQYPVFPWVLADYNSEVLDLNDPATFRDFSKPMGAQTPGRLEQYSKRYREWEDLGGDTPPYHYGTHYSSAMIVASYLVRMEPFTQHFLRLQGGHFDLADRMFHSIGDAWYSASQKNMADVKELIPEFFYLPDFLLNSNHFDLGHKQNGTKLHDIVLPPWAKGSAREFIRIHREALECDYVSAHLHQWIDLVFGYKQKGENAFEANNVFHHLFYEGEVDIYTITDPLKRNATIGFINNFGQIPKQLFKKPHVQKRVISSNKSTEATVPAIAPSMFGFTESTTKVFYRNLDNLKLSANPVKEIKASVGEIYAAERGLLATERNKILIPNSYSRYLAWGHNDLSVRIGYYESERAMQIFEDLDCGEITCAVVPNEKLLITGGSNSVVNVWKIPVAKERCRTLTLKQSLYAHSESVTCLSVCQAYGVLVSGSRDCTCVVWDLNRLTFVRQLRRHKHPVTNIAINSLTGDIFTTCGTFVHMWSINGDSIAVVNTLLVNSRKQHITSLAVSTLNEWDKDSVVATGHMDGYIRFWSLEYVQSKEGGNTNLNDEDKLSIKSENFGDRLTKQYDWLTNPDTKSLDSISLASGQVGSDYSIMERTRSVESLPLTGGKGHDTTSMISVGELSSLPWNDVPQIEVNRHSVVPIVENNAVVHLQTVNMKSNESASNSSNTSNSVQSNILKQSFKWKEQLVLKGKVRLPKSSKNEIIEATTIAMSKDHSKLYTGDRIGRIYSWTVVE